MVDWHLLPGETLIHQTKISRMVFLRYYFFALVLLGFSIAIQFSKEAKALNLPILEISGGLIFLAAIITFIAERFCGRETVALTTERILIRKRGVTDEEIESDDAKKGISSIFGSVRMEALKLETITNVQVRQEMRQRILGMGDLAIMAGNEEHVIKDLHHPFDIEKAIYRIIEKRGEGKK